MEYLIMLPGAFLAPVIHEFVKAICSAMQGDPTPGEHGRLSLNPFRHFEPIGFAFVMLFGFGWGNPTPTSALHYKDRRRGVVITYTVPVLVSLLLGVGTAVAMPFLPGWGWSLGPLDAFTLQLIVMQFSIININLALFNLIPVYPLAANRLLIHFGRPDTIAAANHYEKFMQIGLILLLSLGMLGQLLGPATHHIFFWSIGRFDFLWR